MYGGVTLLQAAEHVMRYDDRLEPHLLISRILSETYIHTFIHTVDRLNLAVP